MKEKRTIARTVNSELPSHLCRVTVILPGGEKLNTRTINLAETGIRVLISSDECRSVAAMKGRYVHLSFPYAGFELSGRFIYTDERQEAITFGGIEFINPYERIMLGRYLRSAVIKDEAV